MEMKKIEGYGIWHRGAIKPLLDSLEHCGHASELEVYFYLMYHANCTYSPRQVSKGKFSVLEGRGQIAISVKDLSSYFKVARNTISERLKSLEKSGCIKTIQNARICNVYEIVSYGETVYEPCKKMALSNRIEQPCDENEPNF